MRKTSFATSLAHHDDNVALSKALGNSAISKLALNPKKMNFWKNWSRPKAQMYEERVA